MTQLERRGDARVQLATVADLISRLAVITGGFDEASITAYAASLVRLDFDALHEACIAVGNTWGQQQNGAVRAEQRPSLGYITAAYEAVMRRRRMAATPPATRTDEIDPVVARAGRLMATREFRDRFVPLHDHETNGRAGCPRCGERVAELLWARAMAEAADELNSQAQAS